MRNLLSYNYAGHCPLPGTTVQQFTGHILLSILRHQHTCIHTAAALSHNTIQCTLTYTAQNAKRLATCVTSEKTGHRISQLTRPSTYSTHQRLPFKADSRSAGQENRRLSWSPTISVFTKFTNGLNCTNRI